LVCLRTRLCLKRVGICKLFCSIKICDRPITGIAYKFKTAKVNGEIHIKGAKVPVNVSSREQKFPRTFIYGSKKAGRRKSREWIDKGGKGPGSESSRDRIAWVLLANSLAQKRKGWAPLPLQSVTGIRPVQPKFFHYCAITPLMGWYKPCIGPIYTVNHKKRWQYICDHNFWKSWSIFIIFALMYRGRNFLLMYEKMSTSPN